MKSLRPLALFSLFIFALTGCGLGNSDQKTYQAVYHMIQTPDTTAVTLNTIKDELAARIAKVPDTSATITIDGQNVAVTISSKEITQNQAISFGVANQITLQEHRTQYTTAEQAQVAQYNATQKSLLQEAHKQAKTSGKNFDDIVVSFSEKNNLLDRGSHGPSRAYNIPEPAYAEALSKTEVGQITDIVELPSAIWFAKLTEKTTSNNVPVYTFQEVIRFFKEPAPRLDNVAIANLSNQITSAAVSKKDTASKSIKDYIVTINLTDAGKQTLAALPQDTEFSLYIGRVPYAKFTIKNTLQENKLVLENQFTQKIAQEIVDLINPGSLSADLALIQFEIPKR